MVYSFLKTVIEALQEKGATFSVRELPDPFDVQAPAPSLIVVDGVMQGSLEGIAEGDLIEEVADDDAFPF